MTPAKRLSWWVIFVGFRLIEVIPAAAAAPAPDVLHIGPAAVLGDEMNVLTIGAGAFDIAREQRGVSAGTSAAGTLELRLGRKFLSAGPLAGVLTNSDGGVYGYGGIYFDVALDSEQRWKFSPFGEAGRYHQGHSKFLGGVFAFQLGGNISYQIAEHSRIGIQVMHISNAFIYRENPGAETALITYGWCFDLP